MADFYFGNLATGLVKRPAPKTDMDGSAVGESETLSFANGGAFVSQSEGTHREFNLSWGVQEKSVMNWLNEYRNGVYGTGLLYMVDPFATNHMPPHWANPGLTCKGWPSLVSPSVQPTAAPAATVTNLYPRPSFETVSSLTQVLRTNLALNPNGVSNGAAATVPNNATQTTVTRGSVPATHPLGITTAFRSVAAEPTDSNAMNAYNLDGLMGTVVVRRVGAWFFSGAANFTAELRFSGGATSGPVPMPQNTWTWVETPTAANSHITAIVSRAGGANGNTVYMTGVVAMDLPDGVVMPQRLDGGMTNTADTLYTWTGAANGSSTTEAGYQISGVGPSYDSAAYVVSSSEWAASGLRSARIFPRQFTNSYMFFSGSTYFTIGKTYTVSMTIFQRAPQPEPRSWEALQLQYREGTTRVAVAAPENRAGAVRVSITFTVSVNGLVVLVNGSSQDLFYDDLLITEGATQYPFFDGNTRFLDGTTGAWSGVANASTSTITRTPGNMPNTGAQYLLQGATGVVPPRKLTLLIPEDRDLYLGFSGVSSAGATLRMQTITREGAYGPVQDLTMLDPAGTTRLNTKVSGGQYRGVQVYMTPTAPGGGTINLVSSKAVYALPTETPTLTGGHIEGEGHTGLRFSETPTMTYVQAANGRKLVSTAANFTEMEAWL